MKKKRGNEGLHPRKPSKGVKKMSTLNALKQKLQGSKFRWLNELMYTKSGEDSFAMIKETPKLFEEYHQGYREQTKQWPERPVDKALKWLSGRPINSSIGNELKGALVCNTSVANISLGSTQSDIDVNQVAPYM